MEISRKEQIRRLKEHLKNYKTAYSENKITIEALSSAIAEAELMERASGGVEKKVYCGNEGIELGSYDEGFDHGIEKGEFLGFNEAIDLCTAHWVGKMRGIEEALKKCFSDIGISELSVWSKAISQALTKHLTEGL